jgi:tetratricopeptide (TPR) repeat protein
MQVMRAAPAGGMTWLPTVALWFILALVLGLFYFFGGPIKAELARLRYQREGQLLLQEHRYNAAFELYKEANQHYPTEAVFNVKLARLYHQQGQAELAQQHYNQALASQQALPLADSLNLARFYVSERQYNKALRLWRTLLTTYSHKLPDTALLDMAALYQQLGVALVASPEAASGKWLLRWAAYYYGEVARRHDGHHYNAILGLGNVYQQLDDAPKAVAHLCYAVRMRPQAMVAKFNLGLSLLDAGLYLPGLVWMRHALDQAEEPEASPEEQQQAIAWAKQWQTQRQVVANKAAWPPTSPDAYRPTTRPEWLHETCLPPTWPADATQGAPDTTTVH